MIRVDQLSFAYGDQAVFTDISFTIREGEILSLVGPNGCGKSTLLKLIRGQLRPRRGNISWQETPLARLSHKQLARTMAVVPQFAETGFSFSVREVVAMGRYPFRRHLLSLASGRDRHLVQRALALCDILHLAERPVTTLSGGEHQRVLVARALAQDTPVLLLDEATSHLDLDHKLDLAELLLRLNREQGTTVIQISHDLDLAAAMSERMLLLDQQGRIVALDSPAQAMTSANLRQLFQVDVKVADNPYTGTPQIHPLITTTSQDLERLNIHLICGGGSAEHLLRRLYLARARVSIGPLNQGDSDEALADAFNFEVIRELPFQPYSTTALKAAGRLIEHAEVLIVTTPWWGSGNLACLDLAEQALDQDRRVFLYGLGKSQDFTGGKALARIGRLAERGGESYDQLEPLLQRLEQLV